jgi:hypothetical protein
MATFSALSQLANEMLDDPKASKRREAAERLSTRLSDPQARQRLATEAPSFKALQEFWRFIVQNAILAVQKTDSSKAKVNANDIQMAFTLIKLSELTNPDEVYTKASKLPPVPAHLAVFRDTFLLGKKQIRLVFNFCLETLEKDREIASSENQALQMIASMVSQKGYIASFRSESEMQLLLEEVEKRILPSRDGDMQHTVQVSAAQIFGNMLRTATVELRMDLPRLMAGSVKLVAVWCAKTVERADSRISTQAILMPLLEGIACLMRINPEQACEPIKRHGKPILKLAKIVYRQTVDRQYRDILHDYFLAHLYV